MTRQFVNSTRVSGGRVQWPGVWKWSSLCDFTQSLRLTSSVQCTLHLQNYFQLATELTCFLPLRRLPLCTSEETCVLLGLRLFDTWAGGLRICGIGQTPRPRVTVWRWDSSGRPLHLLLHLREGYQGAHGIVERVVMLHQLADPFRQTWGHKNTHIRDRQCYCGEPLPSGVQHERLCRHYSHRQSTFWGTCDVLVGFPVTFIHQN